MCNLYSMARTQDEIRRLFGVDPARDRTGNLAPLPAIYPDQAAPVVAHAPNTRALGTGSSGTGSSGTGSSGEEGPRSGEGGRELRMMRWGFPPPPKGNRPVTNVRNTKSGFWRAWLKPEHRCLVPVTSFCEWTDSRPKVTHWFALSEKRPLFAFAGIRRPWKGVRKESEGEQEHELFSFLTTDSNAVVGPVHAKAMPVILGGEEASRTWMESSIEEALQLQAPAPDELLKVVATGEKKDGLEAA